MADVISADGAIPFPRDPVRTAVVQTFTQPGLIADDVLPPTSPLGDSKFKWYEYSKDDAYTVPSTALGRTGRPEQVEFGAVEHNDATDHHGLLDMVPVEDVDAASGEGLVDPGTFAAMMLAELLMLAREKRVADLVFSPATYGADYRKELDNNTDFKAADSDPWGVMEEALSTPLVRPNLVVFGQAAWTAFRRHPKVLAAVNVQSGADAGLARREAVAEVLEVEEIKVGRSRIATSRQGQDLELARVWGAAAACIYRGAYAMSGESGDAGSERQMMTPPPAQKPRTFGFTAVYQPLESLARRVEGRGIKGVEEIVVRESCKEVVSGGSAFGYLVHGAA